LPETSSEQLDRIYICKQCKTALLFASDVSEHVSMTGHADDFDVLKFE
jgi:hypothetical protein